MPVPSPAEERVYAEVSDIAMSVARSRIETVTPETLIAFEARWPRHTPDKDERIRRELGITPTRYYQLLHRAVKSPEGITADPITARSVRELGERRAASRASRFAA